MFRLNNYLSQLPVSRKLMILLMGVVASIALVATSVLVTSAYFMVKDHVVPGTFFLIMSIAGVIILIFFFLLTFFTTSYIKRYVSQPVLHLTNIANRVSENEDYSVRACVYHNDEIGSLVRTFNIMLSRIEARDQLLTSEHANAEQASLRAQQLASEMHSSNQKLAHEVQVRIRAEKQLKRFQNYLNNIIDSMPSALLAVDEHLCILQCNTEAAKLADLNYSQIIAQPFDRVLPFLEHCKPFIEKALVEQSAQRVEKLPINHNNYLDLVIYPLIGDEELGAVIRIDNITQRLKLEEIVVQSEKMMSVGGLAAGMAHEINNPLGAIIQNTQNIRRRFSNELEVNQVAAQGVNTDMPTINNYLNERGIQRFIDNIEDAGIRASTIVSNMLQFSRRDERSFQSTNLSELIDKTIEIAASDFDLKKGFDFMKIQIVRDLSSHITDVPCIAGELQQVLLNLLKNAAQAINRNDAQRPGVITIKTELKDSQAIIRITDNGSGMDEEVRRRVFEPFFTTKDVGLGTGLGLSVSYFIITDNHKGTMSVISVPGEFTQFTIKLPLHSVSAAI
ncbi:hypothetical protein ACH42_10840 [Endozoicomonas sp. (ex Bugula neritina AB1)]|nr:hypothetical protein ACH42_10840 [Endozoicomonas sp. (ex Bugula neritina AB1)]